MKKLAAIAILLMAAVICKAQYPPMPDLQVKLEGVRPICQTFTGWQGACEIRTHTFSNGVPDWPIPNLDKTYQLGYDQQANRWIFTDSNTTSDLCIWPNAYSANGLKIELNWNGIDAFELTISSSDNYAKYFYSGFGILEAANVEGVTNQYTDEDLWMNCNCQTPFFAAVGGTATFYGVEGSTNCPANLFFRTTALEDFAGLAADWLVENLNDGSYDYDCDGDVDYLDLGVFSKRWIGWTE